MQLPMMSMGRHFYMYNKCGGGGGWGVGADSLWGVWCYNRYREREARPRPEGLQVWQSHGFLEESSDACICPEESVPMDAGQHLALGKWQSE